MSEFHGGFFVRSLDSAVAEPIRLALVAALRARRIDPERHRVAFAALRGCPVMHVAVRGPVADGKDYAYFHHRNAAIGADVARAARAEVWAYHYENQTGSESVHHFHADGSDGGGTYCSWDDLVEQLRGNEDDDDDDDDEDDWHDAAPLGVLATTLRIPRGWLDMELAYDSPSVTVALTGPACTDEVAAYLAAPLRSGPNPPPPERRTAELDQKQTLYFPTDMLEDIDAVARRLQCSLGTVAWLAWETAKPELYTTTPIVDGFPDDDEDSASTKPKSYLVPPPSVPPTGVNVPRDAPEAPGYVPAGAGERGSDKVGVGLALPSRVLSEIQDFATSTDRSMSWSVQKAFKLARNRLHASSRA